MPARHVVVDGSNIATEGRSLPSLVQLDVAVREYRREFPEDVITVVVDATFGHRIDPSERADFDEAVAHNEIVSPPAGAIGRGDAFLLRVAEKVGATVLSNDSFQEFHGEHEWLFNNGRLIGGKPVPGVGWIFTPRTPVRGPKSRDSMREARRVKPRDEVKKVQKAIAVAIEEAVEPDSPKVKRRRRSRGGSPPAEPVNEPLPFIEFVATHPLGSPVDAEVESFSSHGAFVTADGLRCYIPLSGLGDPAPRAAKEVLKRGETRQFVLQALDPPRRGIELALAEFAHVSGSPTAETVEEEIRESARKPGKRRGRSRKGDDDDVAAGDVVAGDDGVVVVATDVVVRVGEEPGAEPAAARTRRGGRSRKAAAEPAAAEPVAEEPVAEEPVAEEPAAAKTRRGGRGRKAGDVAATPDEGAGAGVKTGLAVDSAAGSGEGLKVKTGPTVDPAAGRGEVPIAGAATGGRGRGRSASKRAAATPVASTQEPAGTGQPEAAATGPKKRPARPRAGAPRAEPAKAPVPLAPVEVTAAVPAAPAAAAPAVPAALKAGPSPRGRAQRKAAAAPLEVAAATPVAPEVAAPPAAASRPARKRPTAATPTEPAVSGLAPAAARRATKKAVAAPPKVSEVAPRPARSAVKKPAAVADGATPESETAPAASRRTPARKPASTEPATPAPVVKKAPAKKAPAKKAPPKKAPAKRAAPSQPRKRGADPA